MASHPLDRGCRATLFADAPLTALVMSFILPSSCYATMALREVMKTPTDSQFQASLQQ